MTFTDVELEAIRKALHELTYPDKWPTIIGPLPRHRARLRELGFPESVIRWVLDDPSPDSPADKPCETCGGTGKLPIYVLGSVQGASPCPSCRGGEHQ